MKFLIKLRPIRICLVLIKKKIKNKNIKNNKFKKKKNKIKIFITKK